MKKLTLLFCSILLTFSYNIVNAQTGTNNTETNSHSESSPKNQNFGVLFTPEGILKTTESGGTKSVKVEEPVTKSSKLRAEAKSAIEKISGLQIKYAMMLNVDVESLKNLSLLGFIEDWFGTRYKYGGTSKKGIDCSALTGGLLMAVYGFALPRTAKQQYQFTERIKKEELKEGDLVFFNTTGGISHVGFYLENGYFVHASSSQGVTISSLEEPYFSKRYLGAGRLQ